MFNLGSEMLEIETARNRDAGDAFVFELAGLKLLDITFV